MKPTKNIYIAPEINHIKLDSEISLQLASDAPYGPGENMSKAPDYFDNDPFKASQA